MNAIYIVDKFPCLANKIATVFRYDRWNKVLILEILKESDDETELYLYFEKCKFIQFTSQTSLKLNEFKLLNTLDDVTVIDMSNEFIIKCSNVNLWDENAYETYITELCESIGAEFYSCTLREVSFKDLE